MDRFLNISLLVRSSFICIFLTFFQIQKTHSQTTLQRLTVTQTTTEARGTVFINHPDKAGVIIVSPLTNLRFGSNMNGIVEENHQSEHGEYVLIIEPFTQIITIDAPGYMQERIRIGSMAPREVMYFLVEPEERTSELISLIFNVEPADATLFVDGEQIEINRTVQLLQGDHMIRLERSGYGAIDEQITVTSQNIQFNYSLNEIEDVPVHFMVNVDSATILIDGNEAGQTDFSGNLGLWLFPGDYQIEIRRNGFFSVHDTIKVSDSDENRIRYNLERNAGELLLTIVPEDANIRINRRLQEKESPIFLTPGRYRLDIEKTGFEPYNEIFNISLNERISRNIVLEAHTGTLRFSVNPVSSVTRLINENGDTIRQWTGLQLIRDLPAGTYNIVTSLQGYQTFQGSINITKDGTVEKFIELIEVSEGINEPDIVFSCEETVSDLDGNVYQVVQIHDNCWMAENLAVSRFNNGEEVPYIQRNREWNRTSGSARSYFNHESGYRDTFGVLYNWFTVTDQRNICPTGWKIPSDQTWTLLQNFLEDNSGGKLKSTEPDFWMAPNSGATNVTGFSALPGGQRMETGEFNYMYTNGFWWSSTEHGNSQAVSASLFYASGNLSKVSYSKNTGFSVRCVKI